MVWPRQLGDALCSVPPDASRIRAYEIKRGQACLIAVLLVVTAVPVLPAVPVTPVVLVAAAVSLPLWRLGRVSPVAAGGLLHRLLEAICNVQVRLISRRRGVLPACFAINTKARRFQPRRAQPRRVQPRCAQHAARGQPEC